MKFKITYNIGIPPYYGEIAGIFEDCVIQASTKREALDLFYDSCGDYYVNSVTEVEE